MFGTGPEVVVNGRPDEGTIAHLWQLLMAGQLPVLAFFAIKWLPRRQGKRSACWQYKPEQCSLQWLPSIS